jgi:hypothetical protein
VCIICFAYLCAACDATSATLLLVVAQAGAQVQQAVRSTGIVTDDAASEFYSLLSCTRICWQSHSVALLLSCQAAACVVLRLDCAFTQCTVLCAVCRRSCVGASQQRSCHSSSISFASDIVYDMHMLCCHIKCHCPYCLTVIISACGVLNTTVNRIA